ncbi:MAG: hypothetical protein V1867_03305 [Candidatus Falkowbacteria bacterium]
MRNIWNLIVYSFSPKGLFSDILEEAEFIHFKIALALLAFLPILLVEFFLNVFNCGLWIVFLAAAVSFIVAFAATRPKILAEIAAIGAALPEGKKATQGIKDISALYFSLVVKILLWFNLISVFMATIPVRSFPMGFPLVIFSLFIIGLMTISWDLEIKYAKKIAYAYVVGTIIVGITLCVPRATYLNWIEFYPFEHMITSETAKVLSDIDEALAKKADEDNADALEKIEDKIKDGKPLNSSDQGLLEKLRKERSEGTIPHKVAGSIGGVIDGVKETFKGTPPPPQPTPEEQLRATLKNSIAKLGQPQKVEPVEGWKIILRSPRAGQKVSYLSLSSVMVKDDGGEATWRPAIDKPFGYTFMNKDVNGPLKVRAQSTVYVWIIG